MKKKPDGARKTAPYRLPEFLPKIIVPVGLIAAWIIVSTFEWVRPLFIPPPEAVWKSLAGMYHLLPKAILTTVAMTLTGFGIGVAFGTVSGLVMAYSKIIQCRLKATAHAHLPPPFYAPPMIEATTPTLALLSVQRVILLSNRAIAKSIATARML